jgi:signal transduction histidine kinase
MRTASFGLAILYASLFAASAAILGVIVYWTVQTSLEQQMTTRIATEVELLKEELRSEGQAELLEEVDRRSNFSALEYLLLDSQGNRIAGNLPVVPATLGWSDISGPIGTRGEAARMFRIRSILLDNGMRLAVADDFGSIDYMRHALLEASGWAFISFLVLCLAGGLLLSHGFLRRVDTIRRTAEEIIGGELGSRIPLRGTNDNFDLLSRTLNQMLDRIQVLMDGMKQMSSDIAHALRTPLSRLQQKLEAAHNHSQGNTNCESAIDSAQIETERILDTFSALLRIAQIEVGARNAGFREIDISTLFETVFDAYAAAADDEGKVMTANIEPSITALGDKELLTEMLANLLDNAMRHTPKDVHIEVSLTREHSQIVATVADNGLGVPQEARDRIFQRFYRLERSAKIEGNGLGLSLVAAVAGLHGVQLSVEDNAPGLRVTMRFDASAKSARKSIAPH